jgi:hypothetical protein
MILRYFMRELFVIFIHLNKHNIHYVKHNGRNGMMLNILILNRKTDF